MRKVLFILGLIWANQIFCDSATDRLQSKLNSIHTMSASFDQVVRAHTREVSHSSGTMALSRPGHFRWESKKPMAQWVIADGQHVWIYDIDLEQVTVKKQDKGLGGTAALFLSGYDNTIARDFEVTAYQKNHQDYLHY